MAYETGTANGHLDLLDKLRLFASTHIDLVNVGQQWTIDRWTGGNELIMHGPGLAGTDAIYVGVRAFQDIGVPYFNLGVRAAVGFDAGLSFANQPGVSPEAYVLLDDDPMTYWFVGNGRRIVGVVKVGAVYQAFYLGLFLPYAAPTEYPYPILVGGTRGTATKTPADTYADHRLFFDPGTNCVRLRGPGGTWYAPRNYGGTTTERNYTDFVFWPYQSLETTDKDFIRAIRDNADGSYTLLPIVIAARTPIRGILGELDGCHYCSGFSRSAEDIVQIGGVDHLLVQNAFRTEQWHFMALRLE